MRLGLLGGTFNPIHDGHLALARAARAALGLDRLVLVPSARPPHKRGDRTLASAEDRLAMARLAVEGDPGLSVSDLELRRSGPSYTIDTVRSFLSDEPDTEVYFVVGADSLPELGSWKDAPELLRLARFAVAARPGHDLEADLARLARDLGPEAAAGVRGRVIAMPPSPVSATEIRARVAEGRPLDGLLPPRVRDYIRAKGLYRSSANVPDHRPT